MKIFGKKQPVPAVVETKEIATSWGNDPFVSMVQKLIDTNQLDEMEKLLAIQERAYTFHQKVGKNEADKVGRLLSRKCKQRYHNSPRTSGWNLATLSMRI